MSTKDRVIAVCEHMSGKEAHIDSDLVKDLELDSTDRIALAMELEDTFGIEIPDIDVDRRELGTVSGLVEYIEEKLNADALYQKRVVAGRMAYERPGAEL